ncbi:MAG: sulfite exporter TauE/SafE family protein [Spirochaetota bacterium]
MASNILGAFNKGGRMDLGVWGLVIVGFAAFLAGISRTGIPGLGMALVPLVALVMPALASMGFLLLIFVAADLMSVVYFRRKVAWPQLFRILPWTLVGVILGYFAMGFVNEGTFKPILGSMILTVVVLDFVRKRAGFEFALESRWFSAISGILAGIFTMMANAAGPIMTIYLLSMNMAKEEFIGTSAYFYFIINLVKVPLSIALGLITFSGFKLDLELTPLVALGCVAGVFIMKRVSQRFFNGLVQAIAALGGIKLFF